MYGAHFQDLDATVVLTLKTTLGDPAGADGARAPGWMLAIENCFGDLAHLKQLAAANRIGQLDSLLRLMLHPYVAVAQFQRASADILFAAVAGDPRRLSAVKRTSSVNQRVILFLQDRETIYIGLNSEEDLRQGFVDPPAQFFARLLGGAGGVSVARLGAGGAPELAYSLGTGMLTGFLEEMRRQL